MIASIATSSTTVTVGTSADTGPNSTTPNAITASVTAAAITTSK